MKRMKPVNGINTRLNIRRDWHFCPRCQERAVDRANRICRNCKGILLWSEIDDGSYAMKNLDWFYVWTKIGGIEGWFDASFFGVNRKDGTGFMSAH